MIFFRIFRLCMIICLSFTTKNYGSHYPWPCSSGVYFKCWFSLIHFTAATRPFQRRIGHGERNKQYSHPKMERKFKKTKYNVQPRIDTNLTSKRKEKVAKSSAVATPRLRLTTPIPYNTSRSRDPSPARGASRSRDPSPAKNANRWKDPLLIGLAFRSA